MWVSKYCHYDFAILFLKQEQSICMEFSDLNEVTHVLVSFRDKAVELELAGGKK